MQPLAGVGWKEEVQCPNWPAQKELMKINPLMCILNPFSPRSWPPPCHLVASIVSLLALGSPLSPIAVRVRCKPDHFTSHLTLSVYDYLTLSFRVNPASLHSHAWLSDSGLISSCCPGHRAATVSILLVLEPNKSFHLSGFAPALHLPGRSLIPKSTSQSFSQLWAT